MLLFILIFFVHFDFYACFQEMNLPEQWTGNSDGDPFTEDIDVRNIKEEVCYILLLYPT